MKTYSEEDSPKWIEGTYKSYITKLKIVGKNESLLEAGRPIGKHLIIKPTKESVIIAIAGSIGNRLSNIKAYYSH